LARIIEINLTFLTFEIVNNNNMFRVLKLVRTLCRSVFTIVSKNT